MQASNADSPPRRVRGQNAVSETKWETVKARGMKKTGKKEESEVKSKLLDKSVIDASQDLSATESDVCTICNESVLNSHKGLKCDCCKSWQHTECEQVSDEVYQFLGNHEDEKSIHWYCKRCTNVLSHLLTTVTRIDEAQKRFESKFDTFMSSFSSKASLPDLMEATQSKMEAKVEEFTEQLQMRVEISQNKLGERVEELSHHLQSHATETRLMRDSVEDAVRIKLQEDKEEEEEINKRKCSVIVHGLAEPSGDTAEARVQSDCDQLENLFHKIELDTISVKHITRLGKRAEEPDAKPRPVKLTVASETHKDDVLKQAKNLRRIKEGGMDKVFIHQDLTPRQRQRRKLLVQELKDRQQRGEQNLILVNWKIVTKQLRRPVDPPQIISQ